MEKKILPIARLDMVRDMFVFLLIHKIVLCGHYNLTRAHIIAGVMERVGSGRVVRKLYTS